MGNVCWPLTGEEVKLVLESFIGTMARRNKALWIFGCCTGYRISEILSLRRRDLIGTNGVMVERVNINAKRMKGGKRGRWKWLAPVAKEALMVWLDEEARLGFMHANRFVFVKLNGERLSRQGAWKMLKTAYGRAGLNTNGLGTHTMRKTYAEGVYRYFQQTTKDPMRHAQKALDHQKLESTESYLAFIDDDMRDAISSLEYTKVSKRGN